MRQSPRGRWLRFRAEEDLSVASVAFAWRARFYGAAPQPADRRSLLRRRGRAGGPALGSRPRPAERRPGDRGGPGAPVPGRAVLGAACDARERLSSYRPEVDDRVARRLHRVGGMAVTVRSRLRRGGRHRRRIARVQAAARVAGDPTPWSGEVSDYAGSAGVRVPTRAESVVVCRRDRSRTGAGRSTSAQNAPVGLELRRPRRRRRAPRRRPARAARVTEHALEVAVRVDRVVVEEDEAGARASRGRTRWPRRCSSRPSDLCGVLLFR